MTGNTPTSTKGEKPIENGIDGKHFVINRVRYTKEEIERIQSAGFDKFQKMILDKLPLWDDKELQNFLKGRIPSKSNPVQPSTKPTAAPAPKIPEVPKPPSAILVRIAKVREQLNQIFDGIAWKAAIKFNSSKEDAKLAIGAFVTISVLGILGGGVITYELLQPKPTTKSSLAQGKKKSTVVKKDSQSKPESAKLVAKPVVKTPEVSVATTPKEAPTPTSPKETPNTKDSAIIKIDPKNIMVRADKYSGPQEIIDQINQFNEKEAVKDAQRQERLDKLEQARKTESQIKQAKKEWNQ